MIRLRSRIGVAASTLTVAAQLGEGAAAPRAQAPEPAELYDLNDMLTDAAPPTADLITITPDGDCRSCS